MSKQTVPYIALQLTPGGQRCWTSITKLSFWNCSQDFQSREHIGLDRWLIAVNSYDGYYLIQPIAQINSEPCPSANKIPSWAILPRGNGLHFGLILRDSGVGHLVCTWFNVDQCHISRVIITLANWQPRVSWYVSPLPQLKRKYTGIESFLTRLRSA